MFNGYRDSFTKVSRSKNTRDASSKVESNEFKIRTPKDLTCKMDVACFNLRFFYNRVSSLTKDNEMCVSSQQFTKTIYISIPAISVLNYKKHERVNDYE